MQETQHTQQTATRTAQNQDMETTFMSNAIRAAEHNVRTCIPCKMMYNKID